MGVSPKKQSLFMQGPLMQDPVNMGQLGMHVTSKPSHPQS